MVGETPWKRPARAAATAATCVPWASMSDVSVDPVAALKPGSTRPRSSLALGSTPVSRMAIGFVVSGATTAAAATAVASPCDWLAFGTSAQAWARPVAFIRRSTWVANTPVRRPSRSA